MFEDIIGPSTKDVAGPTNKNTEGKWSGEQFVCPACGATSLAFITGVLTSSDVYTQKVECKICGKKWNITYDDSLTIIDVTKA